MKSKTRTREVGGGKEKSGAADNAEPRAAGSKISKFRVKAGHTVTVGETDDDGETAQVTYGAGEEIELSTADAEAMPWAVEKAERRSRSGQTARLEAKIETLMGEIETLKEASKNVGKEDPGRAKAVESILSRGDNYGGRGEPAFGSVPREVVENFERGTPESASVVGGARSRSLDEETGYKGIGRANAGDTEHGGSSELTSPGGQRTPGSADLEDGGSLRPGASDPSDV